MSLVQRDPALHERLAALARAARMVFVAGLPGTGKSLVIHQLAHLAAGAGREVHLLQWDVARPVFEATAAGRRYPVVDGVTQPMVRVAVGRWARGAVAAWDRRSRGRPPLLIGETPLVGHRLIELARPLDDAAEPALRAAGTHFVIAVPTVEVRAHVERERARRTAAAANVREREDAPPAVLHALWRQVAEVAPALGLAVAADAPYTPAVYRHVYASVLRARAPEALVLATVLPTAATSVYDFQVPCADLVPTGAEAAACLAEAEASHPDPAALARAVERWWVV